MLMKVDRVDFNFYETECKNFFGYNVFVSKDYLETFSGLKNIKIFSISSEDGIEAFFPVNEKKTPFGKFFLTPQFTQYFNIILKSYPKDEKGKFYRYRDVISTYSNFLKKNYVYFSLPLHYAFEDVRFFRWNGLKTEPFYTYIVESFKERESSKIEDLKIDNDAKKLFRGYKESYKGKLPISEKDFIYIVESLKEKGILKIFSNSKAEIAVLFDDFNKVSYLYIITGKDTYFLIEQIFQEGYFKGYSVDLLGANTERIAKYKSKLKGVLKLYFKVGKKYVIL
ncbi:MAG: hypothetical protein QME48_01555 [bacterium]|uniref:BioF2-like acetyltransferase domain-containing protein n=2 Tax=Bacteria candidate phyla TaxID=1783234 RepID=A0A101I2I4_UNCT6|nr:MAG: hypothetical protein XD76_1362 [candidate division TA06 bacterium 32_111]KUK86655.1 MAG: hypothetical protein XE03_1354 [candidate division TA06 bacterium 34_109]MDI6699905.1 hypothetical protein [bacterium]HCP16608.1 hypothetical protein [candidate division WOR-3 bacterium]